MYVIGHRGIPSLALENSHESFVKAQASGVDAIELDVRFTKDRHLIVCHDNDLYRLSDTPAVISESTLSELKHITLHNGEYILTLAEALQVIGATPVIIELKQAGTTHALLSVLREFPQSKVQIASFHIKELVLVKHKAPHIKVASLQRSHPLEAVRLAHNLQFDGIGLNFWIMNPLTYWLAKRYHLHTYVYTVNNRFIGLFFQVAYPRISLCTNYPQRFKRRHSRQDKSAKV